MHLHHTMCAYQRQPNMGLRLLTPPELWSKGNGKGGSQILDVMGQEHTANSQGDSTRPRPQACCGGARVYGVVTRFYTCGYGLWANLYYYFCGVESNSKIFAHHLNLLCCMIIWL